MIHELIDDISLRVGFRQGPAVSMIDGKDVGCLDVFLLHLNFEKHFVSTLAYKSEIDRLQQKEVCERLETRIESALLRLKLMLEP
jgi:hypothetical protein